MGGCLSSPRNRDSSSSDSRATRSSSRGARPGQVGKNKPLRSERPKWKSDISITEGQLRGKRDEFWETAPAFEGRKEIWDALKAASCAQETGDHALAQAIVDGANISLPSGTLMECYDELGARYQVPVYVLSAPSNLIEEPSHDSGEVDTNEAPRGSQIAIKLRLSSGKDIKMTVNTEETVLHVKRRLQSQEDIVPSEQRWLAGGKMLVDKLKIKQCGLEKGFVVQVIVSQPPGATGGEEE